MAPRAVVFDPSAVREARAAHLWYRARSEGAAQGFRDALDAAIETLAAHPSRGASYLDDTRRLLLRRYPFQIVFREAPGSVEVIAVAHVRRRPGYWRSRV